MATQGDSAEFLVGASVQEVPVPNGTAMAGFAAREAPSIGVHDPVTVRALAIQDFCWITVDVCGLDAPTCRQVAAETEFVSDHVVVSATHTHSGPCTMPGGLGTCDAETLTAICAAATRAAHQAAGAQRPCFMSYKAFSGLGIAHNRRHPELSIDPELQVVVFGEAAGDVVAWLVQYPCHPVVLGADNHLISGDYPAFVRRRLEQDAPGSVALFLTGAAGDVNTGHSAESSYSQDRLPKRTFGEAERIGKTLAEAGYEARNAEHAKRCGTTATTAPVELKLEVLDEQSPSELAEKWAHEADSLGDGERALLRTWSLWAREQTADVRLEWAGSVTAVRVGDLLLVGLPGEPFLECAESIQDAFDAPVIVAGYSNGCPGYFPTSAEYALSGYEVTDAHRYYGMPAPFKAGAAETLVDTAVRLGRSLM